jgi:hypothetical protein
MQMLQPKQVQIHMGFGKAVSIMEGYAIVSAPFEIVDDLDKAGAVYLFTLSNADEWIQTQRIIMPTPYQNVEFGSSVAVASKVVVVGCEKCASDASLQNSGAVYIYNRIDTQFYLHSRIDGSFSNQYFGKSVYYASGIVQVLSEGAQNSIYAYSWNGASWQQRSLPVSETTISTTQSSRYKIIGESTKNRAIIQKNLGLVSR